MSGRRFGDTRILAAVISLGLTSACTPTHSQLAPYRDDAAAAAALAKRAEAACVRVRGAGDLPPHPFTTDGCSMSPDGNWADCCIEHDIAYWCGGSADARHRADRALARCVTAKGHSGLFGAFVRMAVRVGGEPWSPLPWRWGYGWDGVRGYEPAREFPASRAVARAAGQESTSRAQ